MRVFRRSAILLLGMLALPRAGLAQETGVIEGRVTEVGTGNPVSDAAVSLVGTNRGIFTGPDGSFRLGSVRPGELSVRVSRLGYGAVPRPVSLAAGATARLDVQLAPAAVIIDEVVVTATGESQRRRESGNTVNTVLPTPERLATSTTVPELLARPGPKRWRALASERGRLPSRLLGPG